MVDTLKEAEDRIRKAMEPPAPQEGPTFSPAIQRIRQAGKQRRRRPQGPQLPMAR